MDPDLFLQFKKKKLKDKLATRKLESRAENPTLEARNCELEAHVDFLSLVCRSLLEVMIEKDICTLSDMSAVMKSVDGMDGEVDGALATQVLIDELSPKPKVSNEKTSKVKAGKESSSRGHNVDKKEKKEKKEKK
jgi:hypothetical protein